MRLCSVFLFYTLVFSFFLGGNSIGQIYIQDYNTLMQKGEQASHNAEYQAAQNYFTEARALASDNQDTINIVNAGIRLGESMVDQGRIHEGQEIFHTLDNTYSSKTSLSQKATIYNNLGWTYSSLGKYSQAKKYYSEGLNLAAQAPDSSMIAKLSSNISNIYIYQNDFEKALGYALTSVDIYRALKDDHALNIALLKPYVCYSNLGLNNMAEPYLFENLALSQKLNNPDLLNISHRFLGGFYINEGNYKKALVYYQKGLDYALSINDPTDIAYYYRNIGQLYYSWGDPDKAITYFNRELKIHETYNKTPAIAVALRNLADCFIHKNEANVAEILLERSLQLEKKEFIPSSLGATYLEIAEIDINKKGFDKALGYISEALSIAQKNHISTLEQSAYSLLGFLEKSREDYTASLYFYRKAYQQSLSFSQNRRIWPVIHLAKAYELVNSDSAYYFADIALDLIEALRKNLTAVNLKAGVFAQYSSFYYDAARWNAIHKKDYKKAFELIESAKARALIDQLAEANQGSKSMLDETTKIKLLQQQKKIDKLYRSRENEQNPDAIKKITHTISDAEFSYESLLEEARLKDPEWNSILYPKTLSAEEISSLCDSKTAIIEYAITKNSLLIFVVSKSGISFYDIPSPNGESTSKILQHLTNAFRDGIISQEEIPILKQKSDSLSRLIWDPIKSKLADYSNLIIVPDGALAFLPFEALFIDDRYLIEDFAIKYLPSVSAFNLIQSPHRQNKNPLLALAGSGFETKNNASEITAQSNFASLPNTIIEVDSIAAHFKKPTVLKNGDVTEAVFKSLPLNSYRYIHFATHGDINEQTPAQSGLILSKKDDMENLFGEDGYLNSSEISLLNLNSDLVVLSACNTGLGKVVGGEGLLGLQRSFLNAGSSAVLVSLWNIYDRSTPLLMSSFYKNMLDYEKEESGIFYTFLSWFHTQPIPLADYKTRALRDTKLKMIKHPYYNHPVHWASFILIGK